MYSQATIKRAQTILANVVNAPTAEQVVQRSQQMRPRTATPSQVNDWRQRVPSDAQMARINRLERTLGYRLSTKATIGTAGEASDLYQSLRKESAA